MLAGKSRGGTPFCRTLKIVFPKSRIFCKALPLQLFRGNSCKISVSDSGFTRRCGLVRPASKRCRFSHHPLRVPEGWHGDFAACGQRSGLLALNLANIFEKLLDQKTFICLRLVLEKPLAYGSARLGHIPSLPWKSQLPLKPYLSLQPFYSKRQLRFFRFSPRFSFYSMVQFRFASQMWATRPHLANIFEKLLDQKTFVCLRLILGKPLELVAYG